MAIFKKKHRPRLPHETSPLKKFLLGFLIVALAALILGGFWFLSKMGPRDVDYREMAVTEEVSEDLLALEEESIELEARFEELMALREPEPEDIELIRRARDLQKSYLDGIGGMDTEAAQRLRNLTVRYENLAAAELQEQSLRLEDEAEELAEKKDYEAARGKYREAFALQDKINQIYPNSNAHNVGRATALQRRASYLTAEPLLQTSLKLESEAEALIEAENWEPAEEKLARAIAIQDQLNREFRGTNQASVARLERLRVQLVGIRSGQSHVEIEKLATLADARKAEGKNLEAARLYQEAARLQRQLNESFRDSPYASAELVAEYQRKAETTQSFNLGRSIERNHNLLRQLLSERRTFEASEVIVELRQDIKQMKEAYPRSSLNDEELELKVRYLNLVQTDLGFIQDRVYEALLPIPEEEKKWRILRTEVSQALFSMIMGTNPSRNRGDLRPVDSVSWLEAKQFCERLSWIMGKPVRLPTENEFRASLGRLRYVVLEDHVWSLSETDGTTQPVGTKEPFASG
ncbi:MAG TPA: SUMF1/EgtB/PvdO family nonheme iron enzyme, partial [Opitutales bacterium]|nr:SUMF1/EgtB/PvdO family nonheme iron enzyme [Opitutales bacterium]